MSIHRRFGVTQKRFGGLAPSKSKSRSSASKRSKSAPASLPPPPVYATRAEFEAWEATVKKHVPTFAKAKDAVREFDSLLMCITGIPEGKRVMRAHHVGKDHKHDDVRVFIRKWKPRQSASSTVDKTKFVAFDLRGPSFYITETAKLKKKGDDGAWCKEDKGEFIITDAGFHTGDAKEGKAGVAAGVFASKLLKRYHALCPTVSDPSKHADTVEHFSKWAISLQEFAKECGPGTNLVAACPAPIHPRDRDLPRTSASLSPPRRSRPSASSAAARSRAKDATFAKECPDCDKADHCLAVDVQDDRTVVDDAHVSPNLGCAQTDFLSRGV